MKKIGIIFSLTLVITFNLFSQEVAKEEAKTIAISFLSDQDINRQKDNLIVKNQCVQVNEAGDVLYYIFNFENGGFVIVAGDKRVQPILAYSKTDIFSTETNNPTVAFWMEHQYAKPIDAFKKDITTVATADITQKWNDIKSGKQQKTYASEVAPLLTSEWNQDKYYNSLCPEDINAGSGYDFRTPNGCVALAMAQIMYYHRFPRQGYGSKSYSSAYGSLSANFSQANYNYEAMSDIATNYSDALARLIYHIGISVSMDYGPDGSGAQTTDVRAAFYNYFRYKNSVKYFERENFTSNKWRDTIKSNLDAGLPVYYAAYSNTGGRDAGHAFVCDGYDQNNLFHFNFGWGGYNNTYFSLEGINPGNYQYTSANRAVLNIIPGNDTSNFFSGTKILTATYGSFNDGSGYIDYRNNTNCSWHILPQGGRFVSNITLKVSNFSLGNGDTVYIYEGGSESGNLIATLSGDISSSNTYSIPNSEAFVVFKSDASDVGRGFTFTYTTTRQSSAYCSSSTSSTTTRTTDSGSITNGAPDGMEYVSSNNCYWAIIPPNANGKVRLAFRKFNLNYGDIIEFLGWGSSSNFGWQYTRSGVHRFSKENPPILNHYYEIEMPTALVYFRTDNDLTDSGFEIYWDVNDTVSLVAYIDNISNLAIYPNPSTDYITVDLTTSSNEIIQLSLYDLLGKEVYSTSPIEVMGNYTKMIDVNSFSKGVYMLRVTTNNGVVTKKVIIK